MGRGGVVVGVKTEVRVSSSVLGSFRVSLLIILEPHASHIKFFNFYHVS